MLRTFTILFFIGLRLNEIQELRVKDIKKLTDEQNLKIAISKTSSERKLYLSPSFKEDLLKLFDFKKKI